METDRLAEEKARGLSISLGYAHRAYASGVLDIIDAPGHEDFIRAMVCGTTGAVQRGDVLAAPGAFPASSCMDVRVALSPTASRALKHLDAVRLMIGTASEMAQIRLLAQQDIAPGRSGHAQIRLARPVSVHAGQHGILRWPSPGETLGGVTILDPCSRPARRGDAPRLALLDAIETGAPPAIAEALFEAGDGAAHEADIARLARQPLAELRAALAHRVVAEGRETGRVVSATSSRTAQAAYMAELSARHERAPLRPWVARENLRSALRGQVAPALVAHAEQALAAAGAIRLGQGRVAVAGHDPLAAMSQGERNRFEQLETDLRAGGLKPPPLRDLVDPGGADAALLELLTEAGRCVILENVSLRQRLVFHVETLETARATLAAAFPPPARFRTGEARATLKTTRKFIVPLLEYFDAQGLTLREGDVRRMAVMASGAV